MTTPTMLDLVNAALEKKDAARRAQFDAAKTNFDKLLALGVITTCDDEMTRAFQWQHAEDLAKQAGVSTVAMRDALDYCRIADSILDGLRFVAQNGETEAEFGVRLQAASDASLHPVADGMKKPCKHNGTKKTPGLFRIHWGEIVALYRCCRCGVQVEVAVRPPEPTPAALEAMKLLALYDRPSSEE